MKISSAKAKGKLFEKDITKIIREAYSLSETDVRCSIGSETGADLKLSAKARSVFPFSVEIKRRKSLDTLYAFYNQASKHYPELIPLVIMRADRQEPLAMLNLDFLLSLLGNKTIKIKG